MLNNRVPHAILLKGGHTEEQIVCAINIMSQFLCAAFQQTGERCGLCQACHLISQKTHPNLRMISPEKEGHAIKIDAIRALTDFVQQTGLIARERFIVISPADALNLSAANALLKMLEEPPPDTYFFLLTENAARLLPTIKSRCQYLTLPAGNGISLTEEAQQQALSLLQILLDLGLKKLMPVEAASQCETLAPTFLLVQCKYIAMDLMRMILGARPHYFFNATEVDCLSAVKSRLSLSAVSSWLARVCYLERQVQQGINFNKLLLVEEVFILWQPLFAD